MMRQNNVASMNATVFMIYPFNSIYIVSFICILYQEYGAEESNLGDIPHDFLNKKIL